MNRIHPFRSSFRAARLGALLLAVALGVGLAPGATAAPQEPTRADVERLQAEVDELRALLQEMRDERNAEAADAVEAENRAADAAARAEAARATATAPAVGDDRLAELERRIDLLAAELERQAMGEQVAPEVIPEGLHGLSPAASKVYRSDRGLSIGGYGEGLYQNFDEGDGDEADMLRAILYFGYKFNDKWLLNTEIELEHASEAFVEFAYLDYLWRPEASFRGGLVLLPMGLTNELHEPTTFLGARRPDVESRILPTTWRENGFGLFGESGSLSYRTYVVNGFEGAGFSAGGLRGGRQKGAEAHAEDLAWVGRLDWTPTPGLMIGGSLYTGGAGQGLADPRGGDVELDALIYEGHVDWRWRGLRLRALGAFAELDGVDGLNRALGFTGTSSVGEELEGYYLEVGYDLLAGRGDRSLTPYVRFEDYDTQVSVPRGYRSDPVTDVESLTLGLAFQPLDEIIFKVDYQDYDNGADTAVDQFNVAFGYIF